EVGGQAEAAQLVVHVRGLAVAGAVDGVGQVQLGRVGVVHARGQLREAVAGEVQRHRVKLRGRQALQVVLQVGLVALGLGPAHVGLDAHAFQRDLVLPAEGLDVVLAVVVHAAHQRVDVARHAADEAAIAVDAHVVHVQAVIATVVVAQVDFQLVGGVVLLRVGVERVEGAGPGVVRTVLDGRHQAVALGVAGTAQGLDAVRVPGTRIHARAPAVTDLLPRLVQAELVLLLGHVRVRVAQGDAQGAVGELVHEADVEAVAVRVHAGGFAQRVLLVAAADRDHAVAVAQRTHGLHVDGARQALADQAGVRGLVDGDAVDQLGRVLVELDAAVVAGADQLAAVEQGGGEVRGQAAHADDLGATGDALRRQARQARDRLGDAHVRQLADVLGRDRLDDGGGVALDRDRALDAATDAGDGDRIEVGGVAAVVLGVHAGRAQRDGRRQRRAKHVALVMHVPSPRKWCAMAGYVAL